MRARTNSTCLQQGDAARATLDEGLCSRVMRSSIIGHNLYATPLVLAASFIQQSIIAMAEARPRLLHTVTNAAALVAAAAGLERDVPG